MTTKVEYGTVKTTVEWLLGSIDSLRDDNKHVARLIMKNAFFDKLRIELEGMGQMRKVAASDVLCPAIQGIPILIDDIIPWSWLAVNGKGEPIMAGDDKRSA